MFYNEARKGPEIMLNTVVEVNFSAAERKKKVNRKGARNTQFQVKAVHRPRKVTTKPVNSFCCVFDSAGLQRDSSYAQRCQTASVFAAGHTMQSPVAKLDSVALIQHVWWFLDVYF